MLAYAITHPSTLDFDTLKDDLERFSSMATMIVYRDKDNNDYEENARMFIAEAKGFERVLLHTDYLLAATLHAGGVHLKSTQLGDIKKSKDLGLFVVVSTHTKDEATLAEQYGADMITFSPIFDTPNKGRAVGVEKLKEIVVSVSIPVLGLGGIVTQEHVNSCMGIGTKGFASIRYFSRNCLSSL